MFKMRKKGKLAKMAIYDRKREIEQNDQNNQSGRTWREW